MITMGKPMGNGIPISGLAAKEDVLAAFSDKLPYFNTFGGNPVSIAAAQAVLKYIKDEIFRNTVRKQVRHFLRHLKRYRRDTLNQ